MTTSLAAAPNLEQIKKQAKELLRAFRAQSPNAAKRFHDSHPELTNIVPERLSAMPLQLSDSQLVVAREYGFPSWPKLKEEVDRRTTTAGNSVAVTHPAIRREDGRVWIDGVANLKLGHHSQTTFIGALSGALAVTEHPYSITDLMGLSGLAFRVRWFSGNETPDCCPSSPVGEFPEEIAAVTRATGWPLWTGYPLGEKAKSMQYFWDEVVASIDDGRPVLAYVLQQDVGVIHGYKPADRSIIGWSYDHGQGDDPVELPIEKIGEWIAFIDKNEGPPPLVDAFLDSLRIAVANFRRDSYDTSSKRGDYHYGARALHVWGTDLTQSDPESGDYHNKLFFVNWWNMSSMHDARGAARDYLRAHADLLPERAREAVRKAADLYQEERSLTGRTYNAGDVFLAPWTGKGIADWTMEVKQRERDLLTQCVELEAKAIEALVEAIEVTE